MSIDGAPDQHATYLDGEEAQKALTILGVKELRPGQKNVLTAIGQGRDVTAVQPTGYGKSLCFQLPAIVDALRDTESPSTLVISPLIALMRDQVSQLAKRGVAAVDINSGRTPEERTSILEHVRSRTYKIIYTSPEQLRMPDVREAMAGGFNRIAVDEAHCVVTWGHDFRPAYQNIREFVDTLKIPQRLAFTATASPALAEQISRELGMEAEHVYLGSLRRKNLTYSVRNCKTPAEKLAAIKKLIADQKSKEEKEDASQGSVIVYCSTKYDVQKVFDDLKGGYGTSVNMYHGDQDQVVRKSVEADFRSGKVRIIVATNAFGMGINQKNVRLIVHHSMPGSIEAYLQETGRAGRDGKPAQCVLLYRPEDTKVHKFFASVSNPLYPNIKGIYSILCTIQERLKKTSGYFPLNYYQVREIVKSMNSDDEADPFFSYNAPMALLQELGILEVNGTLAKLNPLLDEAAFMAVTQPRKAVALQKLADMEAYATHRKPSQDLLLNYISEAKTDAPL